MTGAFVNADRKHNRCIHFFAELVQYTGLHSGQCQVNKVNLDRPPKAMDRQHATG